jgi:ABC-2 type transport system permease protein
MSSPLWMLLAAEWTKFRSLRSTVGTLAAIPAVTIGIAVLVTATGSLAPTDSLMAAALGNAAVGQVVAGILGALVVAGEYGSGTIRATLAATPSRPVVLTAKTLLSGGLVFVVTLAAAASSYVVAELMLGDRGHPPGQPWPGLVGVALGFTVVAVLGVAIGAALRNPAASVTTTVAVILVPLLLGPLWGDGRWVSVVSAPAILADFTGPGPATWDTLALIGGLTLVALLASGWRLSRRDA